MHSEKSLRSVINTHSSYSPTNKQFDGMIASPLTSSGSRLWAHCIIIVVYIVVYNI